MTKWYEDNIITKKRRKGASIVKKMLAIVMSLILIMGLSTTTFATEDNQVGQGVGSYGTTVTGTYVAGTETNGTVFCVDIEWTAMDFTYYAAKEPVWDTQTHTYSESVAAKWEGSGSITVTNHSNAKITATPSFEAAEGYDKVEMVFNEDVLRVASAAEAQAAQTGTITVTPGGSLPQMDQKEDIGIITVTIAEDGDVTESDVAALMSKIEALFGNPAYQETRDEESKFAELEDISGELWDAATQAERNALYPQVLALYNDCKALLDA